MRKQRMGSRARELGEDCGGPGVNEIEFSRRAMMQLGAGGLALAATGGAAAAEKAGASVERPFLSDNKMGEAFGGRAIARIVYGGADIGECRAAVAAVGAGGVEDWHSAWATMAGHLAAAGDASAARATPSARARPICARRPTTRCRICPSSAG